MDVVPSGHIRLGDGSRSVLLSKHVLPMSLIGEQEIWLALSG